MKQFQSVNINDYVKLRLTDYGYQVWKEYYDFLPVNMHKPLEHYKARADAEGYVSFQLWHAMRIFGNYVGFGHADVFEDCNGFIEVRPLVEVEHA